MATGKPNDPLVDETGQRCRAVSTLLGPVRLPPEKEGLPAGGRPDVALLAGLAGGPPFVALGWVAGTMRPRGAVGGEVAFALPRPLGEGTKLVLNLGERAPAELVFELRDVPLP
jgi:hypothetical protein